MSEEALTIAEGARDLTGTGSGTVVEESELHHHDHHL